MLFAKEKIYTYLVPGVGSFGGVEQNGDEFGLGEESVDSHGRLLAVKVGGALLKQHRVGVVGTREELHVPRKQKCVQ